MANIINCEDKFSKALKECGIDKLEVYKKVYQEYCNDREKPIKFEDFGKRITFYLPLSETVVKSVCKSLGLNYQDYQGIIDVMNAQRDIYWKEMKDTLKKVIKKLETDFVNKMVKFSKEADNREIPNRRRNSAKTKSDEEKFESLIRMSGEINSNDDADKAMEELFGKN